MGAAAWANSLPKPNWSSLVDSQALVDPLSQRGLAQGGTTPKTDQ
jgi:hypothetical protein